MGGRAGQLLRSGELAAKRFEKDHKIGKSTRELYERLLEGKVYKTIGDTPAAEVTPEMIAGILNKIGADRQADLTKAAISSTYRWAIKRQEVKNNPAADFGQRAAAGVRANVLFDDAQIAKLWAALEADDIWLSRAHAADRPACTVDRSAPNRGCRGASAGIQARWRQAYMDNSR